MAERLRRPIAGLVLGLGLGLAGCGGGGSHRPASTPATARPTAGDAVVVIRAWSDALARGDVGAASMYFATPSTIQIAPDAPVVTVRTPADARAVNLALPCGAKLIDSRLVARYTDALFLLGHRPGADCGTGTGGTARVDFVIAGGKILVWRRIPDEPGDSSRSAPGYRPPTAPPVAAPGARAI